MAKKSMVAREVKREKLANRYHKKRDELKAIITNQELSFEERMDARDKLNKLPRNSVEIRQRNRCVITGRPRGFHRKFKLSRIMLRDMASKGLLPGVTKASW